MPLQARVLSDRYPVSDLKVTQKNLGYDERRFVCFLLAKNLADTSRIANSWQHPNREYPSENRSYHSFPKRIASTRTRLIRHFLCTADGSRTPCIASRLACGLQSQTTFCYSAWPHPQSASNYS